MIKTRPEQDELSSPSGLSQKFKGLLIALWIFSGGMVLAILTKLWPKEMEQAFSYLYSFLFFLSDNNGVIFISIIVISILYLLVRYFLVSFLINLFRERSVSIPTQEVPGIQPIVVQAIENLFPNIDDQKYAFDYVLRLQESGRTYKDLRTMLAQLSYSKGKTENLLTIENSSLGQL